MTRNTYSDFKYAKKTKNGTFNLIYIYDITITILIIITFIFSFQNFYILIIPVMLIFLLLMNGKILSEMRVIRKNNILMQLVNEPESYRNDIKLIIDGKMERTNIEFTEQHKNLLQKISDCKTFLACELIFCLFSTALALTQNDYLYSILTIIIVMITIITLICHNTIKNKLVNTLQNKDLRYIYELEKAMFDSDDDIPMTSN